MILNVKRKKTKTQNKKQKQNKNKKKGRKENYYSRPTSKLIESTYLIIYVQSSIVNEITLD